MSASEQRNSTAATAAPPRSPRQKKTGATATYTSSDYTASLPLDSHSSNWRKYRGLGTIFLDLKYYINQNI